MRMKMSRKREKNRTGLGLLVVLVTILCIGVASASSVLREERDEKLQEKENLEAQIAEQKEEGEKLDARKNYTGTRKFIEEMARQVLGLVYPDEILFEEEE